MTPKGNIRRGLMGNIAQDVKAVTDLDWQTIIISSGAIGLGEKSKLMKGRKLSRQSYAMIGQDQLIKEWRGPFNKVGLEVGQVLYVNKDLEGKGRWWVIKGLFDFLKIGAIPIVNENDPITTAEIKDLFGFGDNDCLASLVAIAVRAQYLVMLTTVPGVISPFTGTILPSIKAKERKIQSNLRTFSNDSKGSMLSKLKAAKLVALKGGKAIIASYKEKNILSRLLSGEKIGTLVIK
jgi:glutamate 5-kinase